MNRFKNKKFNKFALVFSAKRVNITLDEAYHT